MRFYLNTTGYPYPNSNPYRLVAAIESYIKRLGKNYFFEIEILEMHPLFGLVDFEVKIDAHDTRTIITNSTES